MQIVISFWQLTRGEASIRTTHSVGHGVLSDAQTLLCVELYEIRLFWFLLQNSQISPTLAAFLERDSERSQGSSQILKFL